MKRTALKRKTPLRAKSSLKTRHKPSTKPMSSTSPTISKLKKEADKWHSLATRYRFAEYKRGEWYVKCVTCGVEKLLKEMQCGHFQSRRFNATRFLELNTAPQCVACNMFRNGEQYKFGLFIDDWYGTGTAKELAKEAHEFHKLTRQELETIIADSKTYIDYSLNNC